MKKILLLLNIFGMAVYLNMPILKVDEKFSEENMQVLSCIETSSFALKNAESEPTEFVIQEAQRKMYDISTIENKEQWFIAYKKIIDEFRYVIDPPLTIYDYFTDEEIYLIQRAVETECYDQDFISKCNVANIIINRFEIGKEFGDTIKEVITKENQFAYWRKDITESTILAVEYAYQIEDTTDGCIAFRSDEKPNEWYGWEYVFTDSSGHHFYREKKGEIDG